jgi:DNA polymerase III gamma/tau subunit
MQRAVELDNDTLSARQEVLISHLSALNIGKIGSVFDTAEELAGNRDETLASLDLLLSFARDTVFLHAGSTDIVNTSIRPALEQFAARCTLESALQILGAITETRRAVQRNANNKLALDCLFMKMADVIT